MSDQSTTPACCDICGGGVQPMLRWPPFPGLETTYCFECYTEWVGGEAASLEAIRERSLARQGRAVAVRKCSECGAPQPPIIWRATTPCYTQEVTPERYAKFSDKVKRWYVPVYASQNTQAEPRGPKNS